MPTPIASAPTPSDRVDPAGWTGHVIVCGLHDEGLRIVEQLHRAGVRVVVVDDLPDPRMVRLLDTLGVRWIAADSRLPESLAAAGYPGALALVCAEADDVHTLATALLARELRPEATVVAQLRNAAVGRALQDVGVAVLDVARIAAPAVLEACLQPGTRRVRLGGTDFVVVEVRCVQAGSLRDLYGDLAPIAVIAAGGSEVRTAPGRDHRVSPGDTVVVVGTPEDVRAAGLEPEGRRGRDRVFVSARAPREAGRVRPRSWAANLIRAVERRVKVALLALGLLTVVSVGVLMAGYRETGGVRMSALDALYFTVETIGTVGYGDFSFREQPSWLRLWAVGLMVVGAILATVFFALLTNSLISRRLEASLGRRRVTGLEDHVIVVGAGSIGIEVARELHRRGVALVVLDADPQNRYLSELRAARIPFLQGDATVAETWTEVGIDRARAVVVMTSDDLVNVETGLAVRDLLGPRREEVPIVLRVFDQHLADNVASSFDFRYVRSPATLAAPWFVGAALGLEVVDTFYVGRRPLLVAPLEISAGSDLDGRSMLELSARLRVVSLSRADGTVEYPPRRGTRLRAGDIAHVIGPYGELITLLGQAGAPGEGERGAPVP